MSHDFNTCLKPLAPSIVIFGSFNLFKEDRYTTNKIVRILYIKVNEHELLIYSQIQYTLELHFVVPTLEPNTQLQII